MGIGIGIEKTETTILSRIGNVYESAEDYKLVEANLKEIDEDLTYLSAYFDISKTQAFFAATIFGLSFNSYSNPDFTELARYFNCNPIHLLEFNSDINLLFDQKIMHRDSSRRSRRKSVKDSYSMNPKVVAAIINNREFSVGKTKVFEHITDVLEEVHNVIEDIDEEFADPHKKAIEIENITNSNLHFPLIKKIANFKCDRQDSMIYYQVIWAQITGYDGVGLRKTIENTIERPPERIVYMQSVLTGSNKLIRLKLVQQTEGNFFDGSRLILTDKSKSLLNENGIKLFTFKKEKKGIIEPKDIVKRNLIFSDSEKKQLGLIKSLLGKKKLRETQNRLTKKGLAKGIAVLFHGAPGTGKTESVMQIARQTKREISKIEISAGKSLWYGESEKAIKRIFTDYNELLKESKHIPILFFNEADAIFSKRQSSSSSNVAQTENAIQNILLEELENFQGILIATTNLTENFDSAFERRFLFKVEFNQPSNEVKAKIWKMKLPSITLKDSLLLASKFDFSGGQIDNILRKSEIHEIVHGTPINLMTVLELCDEETFGGEKTKAVIGFS